MPRFKKNKPRFNHLQELGTTIGPFKDILVDIYTTHGKNNRIRYWAYIQCSACGKEYKSRYSSVLYGKRYCKCRSIMDPGERAKYRKGP